MSTKPDYEAARRVLMHRMSIPGGVTPDGDIRDIVDAALGDNPVAFAVAALIAEGGETFEVVESGPRQSPYGEWEQQEPHIVSAKIEPARCLLPLGRYLVYGPIPVESAEAKETPR